MSSESKDVSASESGAGAAVSKGDGAAPSTKVDLELSDISDDSARLNELRKVAAELEISIVTVSELRALEAFNIVFLCDDSGSMMELLEPAEGDAFSKQRTRWDEAASEAQMVVRLATALDTDGVEIYFLNRPGQGGVTDAASVKPLFKPKAAGNTPLTKAVKAIFKQHATDEGKRLLLVIVTDGAPNDGKGGDSPQHLRKALEQRNSDRIFVSFMACTDQKEDVAYLDGLDKELTHVDVCDDYATERKQILRARPEARFTRGDYVAKALLGPILDKWDGLDKNAEGGCCSIM